MIFDLGDGGKRDLYDLPARNLDLHARRGEGLGCFHAPNFTAQPPPIDRNDLDVVLPVKWLQGCECFGYLHLEFLRCFRD